MNLQILYFILAIAAAFMVAAILYFSKKRKTPKILFLLRFLSVLALLVLLINPKWEKDIYYTEKPKLAIAVDNSISIKHLKKDKEVTHFLQSIKNDNALQDKFDISYFKFGTELTPLDSLSFTETQTDQINALNQLYTLYTAKTPIILISDGNQTKGNNYIHFTKKNPIYPVIVGDTTQYDDVKITQLNTNKYTLLGNTFPVEIFTYYKGSKPTISTLNIYDGKKIVFSKKLHFDDRHTTNKVTVKIKPESVGNHYYKAVLTKISNEKNTHNNREDFFVEVIDEEAKILLLSSIIHPDLGAIKNSIESNKQRKVTIKIADFNTVNLADYQLVILYQPTQIFNAVYKEITSKQINTICFTGTNTDWNFLNKAQNVFYKNNTGKTEEYYAIYNTSFDEFVTKDIGFSSFPPLKGYFGEIESKTQTHPILYQRINGIATQYPLLSTYEIGRSKNSILFGEGFWKWRMYSFTTEKSFEKFDRFFAKLVQYSSNYNKEKQLYLSYAKLIYSNDNEVIKASYVDQNFAVDKTASLLLYLTLPSKKTKKIPFSFTGIAYEVNLNSLTPGTYTFKVATSDNKVKEYGSFKVLEYQVEQQFQTANKTDMTFLAENNGGNTYYLNDAEKLMKNLLEENTYKSIQKGKKITKPIIDWYWLLAFIILSLSIEWFIRKYRGLI